LRILSVLAQLQIIILMVVTYLGSLLFLVASNYQISV
jgi:hypothetical protein